jgi:hypothetical protein
MDAPAVVAVEEKQPVADADKSTPVIASAIKRPPPIDWSTVNTRFADVNDALQARLDAELKKVRETMVPRAPLLRPDQDVNGLTQLTGGASPPSYGERVRRLADLYTAARHPDARKPPYNRYFKGGYEDHWFAQELERAFRVRKRGC